MELKTIYYKLKQIITMSIKSVHLSLASTKKNVTEDPGSEYKSQW